MSGRPKIRLGESTGYVLTGHGVHMFDISNPPQPVFLRRMDSELPGWVDCALDGTGHAAAFVSAQENASATSLLRPFEVLADGVSLGSPGAPVPVDLVMAMSLNNGFIYSAGSGGLRPPRPVGAYSWWSGPKPPVSLASSSKHESAGRRTRDE